MGIIKWANDRNGYYDKNGYILRKSQIKFGIQVLEFNTTVKKKKIGSPIDIWKININTRHLNFFLSQIKKN